MNIPEKSQQPIVHSSEYACHCIQLPLHLFVNYYYYFDGSSEAAFGDLQGCTRYSQVGRW